MSRITRISRLRGCGIFRDFAWPADLPEFGRYNLIYGWNGTGKTSLSRILRCLEKRTAPAGEVTVVVDSWDVQANEFSTVTVPVRVFNRDFIAENVFPVGGGDLPPIFVLGAESVEKQRELERLKGDRATAQSRLDSTRSTKQRAEREFDQFCIDRAKLIKDTLRSSGQNPYNNYNRTDFQGDAEKMAAESNAAAHRLSDAERERLLAQHRATPKPKVREVEHALPDFRAILGRLSRMLTTTVVSAAIEALKTDPALATWTREGLRLHRDRGSEQCLFCEQPLQSDRLAALEAHFNAQYEQFVQSLDQFTGELQALRNEASDLRLPNKAELYDHLAAEFETAAAELHEALNVTRAYLDAAVRALEDKKHRAFEQISLTLEAPQVDAEAVEKLNAVIRKHNQACDDFQNRVNEARERLARDMIAAELADFVRLRDAVRQTTAEVQATDKEVRRLETEINKLEREIVEHRQPAEELNEDLRKYLGHDELSLQVKETGYQLLRHGQLAEALSEGERTALALLYFLKSLRDRRFDLRHGVVVLDDPVSSLDANALYLAFGFIRHRTQDAGQLFVLTHNFPFFRQVRNWFHHQKGQNKKDVNQRPARFYMLDRVHGSNPRCTMLRVLDPLLEQYESEYHYLFACVHRAANAPGATALEQNYGLPNVARRLLEMFLAFRRPQIAGELWQKLKDVPFDEAKKVRIARFVHTHSHGDTVGEPEHDPSLLGEARGVLADLLELIKSEDAQHFTAMVGLVSSPAAEGDSE